MGEIFLSKEFLTSSLDFVLKGIKVIHFKNVEEKQKLSDFLIALNGAVLKTKIFIKNEGYVTNPELVDLWHTALNKAIKAGLKESIPQYLYEKANFWGEPQEWLRYDSSMKLVPKLNDLKRLCDNLMGELSK